MAGTYTYGPVKAPGGDVTIEITNYDKTGSNTTKDFCFGSGITIEKKFEDFADDGIVAQPVDFLYYDRDGDAWSTIFYNYLGVLDARITVKVKNPQGVIEVLFCGRIDQTSLSVDRKKKEIKFRAHPLLADLSNISVENLRKWLAGDFIYAKVDEVLWWDDDGCMITLKNINSIIRRAGVIIGDVFNFSTEPVNNRAYYQHHVLSINDGEYAADGSCIDYPAVTDADLISADQRIISGEYAELGRTSSSLNYGATVIPYVLLNNNTIADVLCYGTIRFASDSHVYTVSSFEGDGMHLATGLLDPVAQDTHFYSSNQKQYVPLSSIIEGLRTLYGFATYEVKLDRLRFRRTGDATDYTFEELLIDYDHFFFNPTVIAVPNQSFYSFAHKAECAGVLRAICEGLQLYPQVWDDPVNGSTLLLTHRNPTTVDTVTVANQMERTDDEDWLNSYTEWDIGFPVEQKYPVQTIPSALWTIKTKTFSLELGFAQGTSVANSWVVNDYSLRLFVGGSIYDISSYRVMLNNGTWQACSSLTEAVYYLLFQMWAYTRNLRTERFATLYTGSGGSQTSAGMRLGNIVTEYENAATRTYHIISLHHELDTGETEIVRRALNWPS